jgi:hypothetical protein
MFDLNKFYIENQLNGYSANGEDVTIRFVFSVIGAETRFLVDIGAGDGISISNTLLLREAGWKALLLDCEDFGKPEIVQASITTENVEEILRKHDVPRHFDLLDIDIDGNDYWVWKSIVNYRPRVVIIETNDRVDTHPPRTIPYDPDFNHNVEVSKGMSVNYFGANISAMKKLGESKGYRLICRMRGNALFIRCDVDPDSSIFKDPVIAQCDGREWPGAWEDV